MRLIGLFSLLLGLAMVGRITYSYYLFASADSTERLKVLWERDVELLKQSKQLPDSWQSIKEIRYVGVTPNARKWIRSIEAPIPTSKTGKFYLEILVTDFEDQGHHGAVIQYEMFEAESENKIWELGRTFIVNSTQKTPAITKESSEKNPDLENPNNN